MTGDVGSLSIFHICSDYARQSLYPQLLRAIAGDEVRQFMYVPVRTAEELGKGRFNDDPSIEFRFEHLLRRHHKLMFRTKIRRVLADVLDSTTVSDFRLVHAHFLYSDGAVALGLHHQLGLPYVVAVRNSDVNFFMRYRPDLAGIRNEVLRCASKVIFLSPAYIEATERYLPFELRDNIASKTMVIPNGLSSEWFECADPIFNRKEIEDRPLRLLYVGDFTPNKNIVGIVAALRLLQVERSVTLTVVGGGGDRHQKVGSLLTRHERLGVSYLGRISDHKQLMEIYRSHDVLVMPSFRETFGLAYIEALSQGLPIVHSRGQGVDGYFAAGTVASAVDPSDPRSIAEGIREVAAQLPSVRRDCRYEARRFAWKHIGNTYRDVYSSILGEEF